MKILFFTFGTEIVASSRTRVYQYVPYLKMDGFKTKVISYTSGKIIQSASNLSTKHKIVSTFIIRMIHLLKIAYFLLFVSFYDIVFIQKVALSPIFQRILKLMKAKIIFDFDDAIYTAPPTADLTGRKQTLYRNRLINMIKLSKCICIENTYTKNFASQYNKNTLMITGPIDCKIYFPKENPNSNSVVIGWIGSPGNTIYLRPLHNVFARLSRRYANVVIELIGASELKVEGVNIIQKDWNLETEVENLQDFDIGIMPLMDDEWSRGKGGYKLLQYMAIGIPCVASPVGINNKIIREGVNGFLASSEDEWMKKLSLLIENSGLRYRMGIAGRKIAEENYSLKVTVPKMARILRLIKRT